MKRLYGLLVIRVVAGISFIVHGYPKLEDIAGTQMFFNNI